MDNFFYLSSIRSVSLQLCDIFTGLKINKFDKNGKILNKSFNVPLKFGIKEKFWYWANDKKFEKFFPMIGISFSGLSYNSNRLTNKMEKIFNSEFNIENPTPYDLNYQLTIISKYIIEAEQILEQILPFFNPFLILKININEIKFDYETKVILSSISQDINNEISIDDTRNISYTLDLTIPSYIFKPITDSKIIEKIMLHYKENTNNKIKNEFIQIIEE